MDRATGALFLVAAASAFASLFVTPWPALLCIGSIGMLFYRMAPAPLPDVASDTAEALLPAAEPPDALRNNEEAARSFIDLPSDINDQVLAVFEHMSQGQFATRFSARQVDAATTCTIAPATSPPLSSTTVTSTKRSTGRSGGVGSSGATGELVSSRGVATGCA